MEEKFNIQFDKPYIFEQKEYTGVNLAALDDMTTEQLCQCDRIFERSGGVSAMKELNIEYACIVAAQVTDLPQEFFQGLPAKEGNKIKTKIGAYFFGAE